MIVVRLPSILAALTAAVVSIAFAAERGQPNPATKRPPATGPVDATKTVYDIQITEADKGKTFAASQGKTICLRLPGDKDSGYMWKITKLDNAVVQSLGPPTYALGLDVAGRRTRAGVFIFEFKAAKAGRTDLKLDYTKPGEKKPLNHFNVDVLVKKS
jgi:predicted secreted protein